MIKIQMLGEEFTLHEEEWSGGDETIVKILNSETNMRPFHYEIDVELSVATYIVARNKQFGAEIIYNSEADKSEVDKSEVDKSEVDKSGKPPSTRKYRRKY